mmetsp:Transcript_99343/g.318757  ORF Transcript_99343/g.318757 Transcript_99343/m.318757 type:complete len:237 (+) Transcript_99343:119-829(+)
MSLHEGCDHVVSGLDSDKGSRPRLTRNAADWVFARRTASAPVTLRAQIVTIATVSIEAGCCHKPEDTRPGRARPIHEPGDICPCRTRCIHTTVPAVAATLLHTIRFGIQSIGNLSEREVHIFLELARLIRGSHSHTLSWTTEQSKVLVPVLVASAAIAPPGGHRARFNAPPTCSQRRTHGTCPPSPAGSSSRTWRRISRRQRSAALHGPSPTKLATLRRIATSRRFQPRSSLDVRV